MATEKELKAIHSIVHSKTDFSNLDSSVDHITEALLNESMAGLFWGARVPSAGDGAASSAIDEKLTHSPRTDSPNTSTAA